MPKFISWSVFVLVALIQLYVPATMIMDRENVLQNGTIFRFQTQPVDPSNPFMGKYIILSFTEEEVPHQDADQWESGQPVYVSVAEDEEGFASVSSLSEERPGSGDYFQAIVAYAGEDYLRLSFPFDRYYMEESKSYAAEEAYNEAQLTENKAAWAEVRILDGRAVLENVLIDGIPIRDVVLSKQEDQ